MILLLRDRATVYTQVENFQSETVSRLELKFQADSQSPQNVDWKIFLLESSSDDLRYETRNSFRGGTDALNEDLCVHPPRKRGGAGAILLPHSTENRYH
ncbi:hypothetical protein IQ244_14695 [Nostoc sp. LEGE 06077]|uniref:hypothetical protein n=1 Tax=Nostoc sp. LEGE 06077 TaxID=915325 RepID=UPI00187F3CDA|nr:hypothetical protein [Nostoc sp. LEGE 06077]MBE9207744.1 hypothetical protein [Nostoc sp. LEGE 06077]